MTGLATVATAIRAGCTVAAHCRDCHRTADLDLAALAARGLGNTPLTRLPLRCTVCGSARCQVVVSGRPPHYAGGG